VVGDGVTEGGEQPRCFDRESMPVGERVLVHPFSLSEWRFIKQRFRGGFRTVFDNQIGLILAPPQYPMLAGDHVLGGFDHGCQGRLIGDVAALLAITHPTIRPTNTHTLLSAFVAMVGLTSEWCFPG